MAGNQVCSDATNAPEDRELSYHFLIWRDREHVAELDSGPWAPFLMSYRVDSLREQSRSCRQWNAKRWMTWRSSTGRKEWL